MGLVGERKGILFIMRMGTRMGVAAMETAGVFRIALLKMGILRV